MNRYRAERNRIKKNRKEMQNLPSLEVSRNKEREICGMRPTQKIFSPRVARLGRSAEEWYRYYMYFHNYSRLENLYKQIAIFSFYLVKPFFSSLASRHDEQTVTFFCEFILHFIWPNKIMPNILFNLLLFIQI